MKSKQLTAKEADTLVGLLRRAIANAQLYLTTKNTTTDDSWVVLRAIEDGDLPVESGGKITWVPYKNRPVVELDASRR